MDYLWSPWRYRYISKADRKDTGDDCVFCEKLRENRDEENLILHRGQFNFVILNLYPYSSGHLMVVPNAHISTLDELPSEAAHELFDLTQTAVRHIRQVYKPQGLNVGMNLGECAGAGIAGHIHMHVLPRWPGDANFMTTIGETRVIPEDLADTYLKLKAAFQP